MKKRSYLLLGVISILLCSCKHTPLKDDFAWVTFKNYDDSVLYRTKVDIGDKVEYLGKNPIKEPSVQEVFVFDGWDYDLRFPITKHLVIRALFEASPRKYVATFQNYDGEVLATYNVEYGKHAAYKGATPTKESSDIHFEYTFDGWDQNPSKTSIKKDTVFTAIYKETEFVFATFNDYDDTFLEEVKVIKGEEAIYPYDNPTRSYSGTDKVYRFNGWDKPTENLLKDTVFTAVYNLLNIYKVKFLNHDGTLLDTQSVVHGDTAIYAGPTPKKGSTQSGYNRYTYTFKGWDKSLINVTSSFSTTALFDSKSEYYNPEYQNELTRFKNFCKSATTISGLKAGEIYHGKTGSFSESISARYDTNEGTCYLQYSMTGLTSTISRVVRIYLPPSKPGSYDVYFENNNNWDSPVLTGVGRISGYYDSYTTMLFTKVFDYAGNSNVSWHEELCNTMMRYMLLQASYCTSFDLTALGFFNY